MSEERKHDGKCLLEWLRQEELTEYGSVFLGESVREVIGLVMPKFGTKKEFDQVALRELSAIDYCRNTLLGEGKYLSQVQGDYRILLPSENARQIEQYISNADSKLRRALKLSRNSPAMDGGTLDQTSARILMKREGLKRHRKD
jgi:hypothetical protein